MNESELSSVEELHRVGKILPLPLEMRTDRVLGEQEQAILQQQWQEFNRLKSEVDSINRLKERKSSGLPELAQGTFIHGAFYNPEILTRVMSTGILSGELVGVPEDSETHYCADFFKVPEDMTVDEYMKWCKNTSQDGNIITKKPEFNYLPIPGKRTKQIGFIIDVTDIRLRSLLKYDAYGSEEQDSMGNIVGNLPVELDSEKSKGLAAILVGIPSDFINGVIIGDQITEEEREEIKEIVGDNVLAFTTQGDEI
jgi:hypothetical protein